MDLLVQEFDSAIAYIYIERERERETATALQAAHLSSTASDSIDNIPTTSVSVKRHIYNIDIDIDIVFPQFLFRQLVITTRQPLQVNSLSLQTSPRLLIHFFFSVQFFFLFIYQNYSIFSYNFILPINSLALSNIIIAIEHLLYFRDIKLFIFL